MSILGITLTLGVVAALANIFGGLIVYRPPLEPDLPRLLHRPGFGLHAGYGHPGDGPSRASSLPPEHGSGIDSARLLYRPLL